MTGSEVVKAGTADEEGEGGRQEEGAPWGGRRGCWDSGREEEVHQKRSEEEEASFLEATSASWEDPLVSWEGRNQGGEGVHTGLYEDRGRL